MEPDLSPTDQSGSVPSELSSASELVNGSPEAELSAQSVEAPLQPQELESYNPIEPPPLDWRSDSSSDAGCTNNLNDPSFHPSIENLCETSVTEPVLDMLNPNNTSDDNTEQEVVGNNARLVQDLKVSLEEVDEGTEEVQRGRTGYLHIAEEYQEEVISEKDVEGASRKPGDEDHSSIHSLLNQLQLIREEPLSIQPSPPQTVQHQLPLLSESETCTPSLLADSSTETTGLLFSESHHRDLLGLLQFTELSSTPQATSPSHREEVDAVVAASYSHEDAQRFWSHHENGQQQQRDSITSLSDDEYPEPVWKKRGEEPPKEDEAAAETEQVGSISVQPIL